MKKTSTRLADGRELIYFDEAAGTERRAPDRRDLPTSSTSSQLRRDPVLDEWVVIASHRQDRTYLPPAGQCPLCPSTTRQLTEIPADDYDVVVFENRSPRSEPAGAHGTALASKLKYLAGSESGAGVFINDVAPEQAAERLRQAGG